MPSSAPRTRSPEAGSALIEVLIALVLLAILAWGWVPGTRPNAGTLTGGRAQHLRAAFLAAMQRAEAAGGEAVLYADPTVSGEVRGRFVALAGRRGVTLDSMPGVRWTPLDEEVRWGAGAATVGPLGDTITRVGVPVEIRCAPESGCRLGGRAAVTYYLTHLRAPEVVYAVTITQDATVQLFHFDVATRRWRTGRRR